MSLSFCYDKAMTKFLLISEDSEKESIIREVCSSSEVIVTVDETFIFDALKVEEPDFVLIDGDVTNLDLKSICRQIKQYPVVTLLILGETKHNKDITHNINLFIKAPIDKQLLSATIDSSLRTRQSLLKMTKSNQELARSLYQLNVLYNTSSQLAGALDKDRLDIYKDDASIVQEELGINPTLVCGDYKNIKITTISDLRLLEVEKNA